MQPKTKQKKHRKMKNTNPIFSLKNFRSFGEEGADFELAPITVLTGCNSAGKSSLVKALMLLSKETFVKGTSKVISPEGSSEDCFQRHTAGSTVERNKPSGLLKVSSKELGLGRYDKVLHKNASDGTIVMSYKIWSYYLQEEVIVKRFYKAGEDILNEGVLTEYSIEKKDGTTLYKYFWDNERIVFYDPEMGDIEYPKGWEELGNINAVIEKCNKYIDFCSFVSCQDTQKFYSKWYSKFGSSNNTDKTHKESVEKELSLVNKRMEEIKNRWGDEIDEYRLSKDWELTYSPTEVFVDTKRSTQRNEDMLSGEERILRYQNNVFHRIVNECVSPWFIKDMAYIDSSSSSVKRLYSVEDENKMCVALGKLVKKGGTGNYVNRWLKTFGIADSIEVVGTVEGIGIMVYLNKGGEKHLLADEGYGITQLVSLFLQMENIIIEGMHGEEIENEDTFESTYKTYNSHRFIAIEEPEIHLHPKYQSLLADMFVEAYQEYNIHFIIETHSEYLIRKLQVLVADKENKLTPNDVSLNYVDKDENGISTNRKIEILEDGRLSEPFGPGFFDEADSLAMDLMKYKVRR